MTKVTDEYIVSIKQRLSFMESEPFYSSVANMLIDEDIPVLLAEVERLKEQKQEAVNLLWGASSLLDDVHCSETCVGQKINEFLYSEED